MTNQEPVTALLSLPIRELTDACIQCGRDGKPLVKQRCNACYLRHRRGNDEPSRRLALDPEIATLLREVPGTNSTFAARLLSHIDFSGDCWEWTGYKNKGYGEISRGGVGAGDMQAHRAVWELLIGPIPAGMQYDHRCRNHGCVNPDHGEIVTAGENNRRGFGAAARHARRDRCFYCHPFDGVRGGGGGKRKERYCKTCAREVTRKARAA